MSHIDLTELTVEKVQAGFASGAFTSESLTQAYLDRIAEYNPSYNAIVFFNETRLPMRAPSMRGGRPARSSGRSPACRSSSRKPWT